MMTPPSPSGRPLNVVWSRQGITLVLESYFIHDCLMAATGRPLKVHFWHEPQERPFLDDMVVVMLGPDDTGYLAECRRRGCRNLTLFHLGDEKGEFDLGFYTHADRVIRNYFFPHIVGAMTSGAGTPVVWMPNGYRTGIGPRGTSGLLPASQRDMTGFFSGMIHGDSAPARQAMIQVIQQRNLPCSLFGSRSFGGGFGPSEYALRLENSVFGLVPMGNSVETIRLYDCLELGTIPIMLQAEFLTHPLALGGVPFPVLERWEDLEPLLAPYRDRNDPAAAARLDALQTRVIAWWSGIKAAKIAELSRLLRTA